MTRLHFLPVPHTGFPGLVAGDGAVVAWPLQLPDGGDWTTQKRAGIAASHAGGEGGPKG
jgi:hypothetical protein